MPWSCPGPLLNIKKEGPARKSWQWDKILFGFPFSLFLELTKKCFYLRVLETDFFFAGNDFLSTRVDDSFSSFKSLLKCCFLKEAFPDHAVESGSILLGILNSTSQFYLFT